MKKSKTDPLLVIEKFLRRTEKLQFYVALPNLWISSPTTEGFTLETYTYSDRVCGDMADILRPIFFTNRSGDDVSFEHKVIPALEAMGVGTGKIAMLRRELKAWETSCFTREVIATNFKRLKPNVPISLLLKIDGKDTLLKEVTLNDLKSDFDYANLYLNSEKWHVNTKGWDSLNPLEKELAKRQLLELCVTGYELVLKARYLIETVLKITSKGSSVKLEEPKIVYSDPPEALKAGAHFTYGNGLPFGVLHQRRWITEPPKVGSSKSRRIMLRADWNWAGKEYEDAFVLLNSGYLRRRKGEIWIEPKKGHMITLFDPLTLKDGRFIDVPSLW